MTQRFSAKVSAWARKSEAVMDAIVKTAAQRVFEVAQVPKAKGGYMPVDTGFLRNTGAARLNELPSGLSRQIEGFPQDWEGSVALTISKVAPGDVIFMGWTAEYARYAEHRDAFMRTAAVQWPRIVREVAQEVKARAG